MLQIIFENSADVGQKGKVTKYDSPNIREAGNKIVGNQSCRIHYIRDRVEKVEIISLVFCNLSN